MSIHSTAVVSKQAEIDPSVEIGPFAVIEGAVVLHSGVTVGSHAVIKGPTVVGEGTRVFHHAVIGEDPQDLKYAGEATRLEIGKRNTFREFSTAHRGTAGGKGGGVTRIGDDNLFMAYSHVAHDCVVGNGCVFANCAALAGHVVIQDAAILGGLSGVHQHSRVGRMAMVGGGAMCTQDVPPFTIAQGDRARLFGLNIVGLRRHGVSADTISALRDAYRDLFSQGLPMRIALEQVRASYARVPEVKELVEFIENSARGVCRSVGTELGAQDS
jgi:UDP-N-acetylglucosamine acyltransferase